MSDEIQEFQTPLTNDVYCYTARAGDKYYTLVISYIIPHLITNNHIIRMSMGEQVYIGHADTPMYLIPYDDPNGLRYTTRIEDVDLHPSGEDIPPEAVRNITIPMEFNVGVEPFFHFKIEDNQLFKQEDSTWQKVQV